MVGENINPKQKTSNTVNLILSTFLEEKCEGNPLIEPKRVVLKLFDKYDHTYVWQLPLHKIVEELVRLQDEGKLDEVDLDLVESAWELWMLSESSSMYP